MSKTINKSRVMNNNEVLKMKGRMMVVGGSIGAVALLVLAMFPTIVSAQTVKSNEIRSNIFQHFKDRTNNNLWYPGYIFLYILNMLIIIIGNIIDNMHIFP